MLTIGSRASRLALAQTFWVKDRILTRHPNLDIEVKTITTSADADPNMSIRRGSATGVFVKEIEQALMSGEIDLAVHSLKDLPTSIPPLLEIAAVPEREDARDALVSRQGHRKLEDVPTGSIIGTGSMRRLAQILAQRPDLQIRDIRGNVDTRLRKLDAGDYDAVVLACAGLNRLGLQDRISARLSYHRMLPAPGQGALAVESRRDDARVKALVADLHHGPSAAAVAAERAFLQRMGGGCNTPIAAHARISDHVLEIEGLVAAADGSRLIRKTMSGPVGNTETLVCDLAAELLSAGGQSILDALE